MSNNRTNGYQRKIIEKKRLEKLAKQTPNCGWSQGGAWYCEIKERYLRFSRSHKSKLPKNYKKIANKKVRRTDIALKGCKYKKVASETFWKLW